MSLKTKALSGFIWSSAGTLGNGLVSFIVTVILARILTPNDFALVALLTVFVAVSNVIVDSGFSQAIIRDDNPTDRDLSSVFLFNLFVSLLLYLILFFLAPFIANFYKAQEMILLSRVVFLVIIFNAFIVIQNATLKRDLNFALVEKASVSASFVAGVISVIMAFTSMGIWALVANMVLMPFCRGILLWIYSNWRPKMQFSFKSIKKYFGFGIFLMLQGLVDVVMTNLNTLFIGKVYTKNDLGYYSQGGKFDSYIVTPLNSVIDKVVYPIFAKLKNNDVKLKDGYSQMLGMLLFIVLPTMLFVSFNANNVIVFFFGEQWRESGVYLQLLTILGLFQILHKVFTNLIMVKGKTNVMFVFALIKQSLRLLALILTVRISVYAMTVGFVVSGVIGSLLYICLGMYYIKYTFVELIRDNYKTIISTIISIGATIFIGWYMQLCNHVLVFIVQCLIMLALYFVINISLKNTTFVNVFNVIKLLRVKG